MKTYARVSNGIVMEIVSPMTDAEGKEIPITERFTPDFVAMMVDVTNVSPQPSQHWTYDGSAFSTPPEPTPQA